MYCCQRLLSFLGDILYVFYQTLSDCYLAGVVKGVLGEQYTEGSSVSRRCVSTDQLELPTIDMELCLL